MLCGLHLFYMAGYLPSGKEQHKHSKDHFSPNVHSEMLLGCRLSPACQAHPDLSFFTSPGMTVVPNPSKQPQSQSRNGKLTHLSGQKSKQSKVKGFSSSSPCSLSPNLTQPEFNYYKIWTGRQSDDLMFKSTCCPSRGPRLDSQNPQGDSEPFRASHALFWPPWAPSVRTVHRLYMQ